MRQILYSLKKRPVHGDAARSFKSSLKYLLFAGIGGLALAAPGDAEVRPKGLMLNLDLQEVEAGIVPSRAIAPLHVPIDTLRVESVNRRNTLVFEAGQGLSIPHSLLLDPDGSEWVVAMRIYPVDDGLVLSQGNDRHGYAIRVVDGAVQAVVRTQDTAMTLKESEQRGVTSYRKKWVALELRIKKDLAILSLNRRRVALVRLQGPLDGPDMHIRMGHHARLPAVLEHRPGARPDGFSGAVSALKIFRQ